MVSCTEAMVLCNAIIDKGASNSRLQNQESVFGKQNRHNNQNECSKKQDNSKTTMNTTGL